MPSGIIPFVKIGGDTDAPIAFELRWSSRLRMENGSYVSRVSVKIHARYSGSPVSSEWVEVRDAMSMDEESVIRQFTVSVSGKEPEIGTLAFSRVFGNGDWSYQVQGSSYNNLTMDGAIAPFQMRIQIDPFWVKIQERSVQLSLDTTVDIGPSVTVVEPEAVTVGEPFTAAIKFEAVNENVDIFLSSNGFNSGVYKYPLGSISLNSPLETSGGIQNSVKESTAEVTLNIGYDALVLKWLFANDMVSRTLQLCFGSGNIKSINRITVQIPDNEITKPDVTAIFSGFLSENHPLNGPVIRGKSKLLGNLTGTAPYGEISGFVMSAFGKTVSGSGQEAALELPADTYPGSQPVTVTVTDTRGFSRIRQFPVFVHPYQKPRVVPLPGTGEVVCCRSDADGVPTGSGSRLKIAAGGQYTSIVENEKSCNSCTLFWRWRVSGGDWSSWETFLPASADQGRTLVTDLEFLPTVSYEVVLRAVDALGEETNLLFKISTEDKSFSLLCGESGAAFGKKAEFPQVVEIAPHMTLWVRGKLRVDGGTWKTLDPREDASAWESLHQMGRQRESGIYYLVENGNHVHLVFNRAFRWLGSWIPLSITPLPPELRPAVPVQSLCPTEGGVVQCMVGNDGILSVQAVYGAGEKQIFPWLDGYLDYWMEGS